MQGSWELSSLSVYYYGIQHHSTTADACAYTYVYYILILLDLLFQSMNFLSLIVNLIQQVNILRHDLWVLLFVNFLILLEWFSQIIDIVFEISSLVLIFKMKVGISTLIFHFFLDILLVKSNHSSLEFLEISDMM